MRNWLNYLLLSICLMGCANNNYKYGDNYPHDAQNLAPKIEQQFIIGEPSPLLDNSDWIWPGSWLAKLLLWNIDVDSHTVSEKTLDDMKRYMKANNLDDVQVLVNTYKPGLQWKRLFTNREVHPFWRYTFGILSTSFYTILPGRFFGGDHFNPYTNTISIYSDDVAIALHEAGHAKDFSRRKNKGLHAAIYALPGAPLYYEAVATSDALSYLEDNCEYGEEKEAYKTLHPAYGTYVGGTFLRQTGYGFLGAIPGHITGAIAALGVDDDHEHHSACKSNAPFDEANDPSAQAPSADNSPATVE